MHIVIAIIPCLHASYTGLVLMSSSLPLSAYYGLLLNFKFGTVIPKCFKENAFTHSVV